MVPADHQLVLEVLIQILLLHLAVEEMALIRQVLQVYLDQIIPAEVEELTALAEVDLLLLVLAVEVS